MGNFNQSEVCCGVRTAATKQITPHERAIKTGPGNYFFSCVPFHDRSCWHFERCAHSNSENNGFIFKLSIHCTTLLWSIKDLLKLSNLFKCKTSCHQAKFAIL